MGILLQFKRSQVKKLKGSNYDPARVAFALYGEASKLDEDPSRWEDAERLYRRAIALDPTLAIAYTNLGNILFNRSKADEARELYTKALAIEPDQPEAQYNLGFLLLEAGLPEEAIPLLEGAIKADKYFTDAYFNLALALEQCGRADEAQKHWRRYVKLEPEGTWSEIAARHLR